MCVPGCQEKVVQNLSRRGFLQGGIAALAATTVGCSVFGKAGEASLETATGVAFPSFRRVVDLTHTYSSEFPHFAGGFARVEEEKLVSTANGDDWNTSRWTFDEHAGTHIDVPFHRHADGIPVDRIPAENLVLPLAIVDIREKAERNADAEVTVDDLRAWETRHGALPARCCVAMLSGWDVKVRTPEFINFDDQGVRHFPGFHLEAAEFLLAERDVAALAVDTASFDHGASTEFPVHTRWLTENRWALENVAHLAEIPPRGATIVCGAPKIAGATGGPSRVLALV